MARALYVESLRVFSQIEDHRWIAYTLECLAWLAWNDRQPGRAAHVYGAAAAVRRRFGMPGWPATSSEHAEAVAALRTELGEIAFRLAYEAGGRLPLAQAIVEAGL